MPRNIRPPKTKRQQILLERLKEANGRWVYTSALSKSINDCTRITGNTIRDMIAAGAPVETAKDHSGLRMFRYTGTDTKTGE